MKIRHATVALYVPCVRPGTCLPRLSEQHRKKSLTGLGVDRTLTKELSGENINQRYLYILCNVRKNNIVYSFKNRKKNEFTNAIIF